MEVVGRSTGRQDRGQGRDKLRDTGQIGSRAADMPDIVEGDAPLAENETSNSIVL